MRLISEYFNVFYCVCHCSAMLARQAAESGGSGSSPLSDKHSFVFWNNNIFLLFIVSRAHFELKLGVMRVILYVVIIYAKLIYCLFVMMC